MMPAPKRFEVEALRSRRLVLQWAPTMRIIRLDEIKSLLPEIDLVPLIEEGFVAYSAGRSVVPPVGELLLDRGEVHIKYGFIRDQRHYVIKIASGFFDNPKLGLPTSQGLMIVFSQETGTPVALLLDEGFLTDMRTAAAGAAAAGHLAPENVDCIGIVGTGIQARLQLRILSGVVACPDVLVWGRGQTQLDSYRSDLSDTPWQIETTEDIDLLQRSCNLIVTTTPATTPLLLAGNVQPGTHITAVGSDTPEKQELEPSILEMADLVVADSVPQCLERGEIHQAIQAGRLDQKSVVELGNVISGASPGRSSDNQISVADLTGVAVQDIQIAEAVLQAADGGPAQD